MKKNNAIFVKLNKELTDFSESLENAVISHPSDGSCCIERVGDEDDIVQTIRVFVQKKGTKYCYGVSFGVCDFIPLRIEHKLTKKEFDDVEAAFLYVRGLAEKLNELNKEV